MHFSTLFIFSPQSDSAKLLLLEHRQGGFAANAVPIATVSTAAEYAPNHARSIALFFILTGLLFDSETTNRSKYTK
jgi:hypothetical protein